MVHRASMVHAQIEKSKHVLKMMMRMMMTMMGAAAISDHELRASLIALLPAEAMLPGGRASGAPRRRRSRRERAEQRFRLILDQQMCRLATELWRRLDAEVTLQATRYADWAERYFFLDFTARARLEVQRRREDAGLPRSLRAERDAAVAATRRAMLTTLGAALMAAMTGDDGPQWH